MTVTLRLLTVIAALVFAGVAFAQQPKQLTGGDIVKWNTLAARAEVAIDERNEDNEFLESLRAQITNYRADFSLARQVNSERINTLIAQVDALGPVPEDVPEALDITARRGELEKQLSTLQAPAVVADVAFRRADGIIREIDTIIRERQKRTLLSLGPSPLNPLHWGPAFQDLGKVFGNMWAETATWSEPDRRTQLSNNLPLVLVFAFIGLLLIARGRRWSSLAGELLRKFGGRGSGVWGFLISLGRIGLPLLGLLALTIAVLVTELPGPIGLEILDEVPIWGGILLGFRWLAERIFSRNDDEALIRMDPERRAKARFCVFILSILFVLRGVLDLFLSFAEISTASEAVLAFPIVISMGVVLFLLGQTLRHNAELPDPEAEEPVRTSSLTRALHILGSGTIAVSVAAPLMAAVGYASAGNALLYPTIVSLFVLGLVMVLQRFAADIYGWVSGQGDSGREALIPVLSGFLLVLAAIPVLALAWGVRTADLTELWSNFERGFVISDTRISPSDFMAFIVIFAVGYMLTRLVQGTLRNSILPKTKMDVGGQNAIVSGLGYVGIFIAALVAITGAGVNLSALGYVAGALSVGIGFGLQNVVSNFVSGIILLVERPISEGDWIEVGGQMGYVRDISVRSTRIETFERTDVIVPNADLISGTVTNYTRGNTVGRLIVTIGVAYGTDTRKVESILTEIAEAQPMVLRKPPPMILFNNFGADALEFEVRVILRDVNWIMNVKNEINHQIADRFAAEGIEIPFAQRDVWLRNPEVLKGISE